MLAKRLMEEYAPPLVVTTVSLLFGTLVMLTLAGRDMTGAFRLSIKPLVALALAGISAGGAVIVLYIAVNRAPVSVVYPVAGINPLINLILVHLFLQRLERITLRVVGGTVLVVAGVILVVLGTV